MAIAARSDRVVQARARVHADGGALARPMVKTTAGVKIADRRPQLAIVPRRRQFAHLFGVGGFLIAGLMVGAVVLQTQLARRQVVIDSVDRQIRSAREQFNTMREQRAELLSPGRLAAAATNLGMHPSHDDQFMTVAPEVVADVQQSAGAVYAGNDGPSEEDGIFQQFEQVKAVEGG